MSVIIDFFKTLWTSLTGLFSWLVGIPALILSFFIGIVSSIKAVYSNLYQPVSALHNLTDSLNSYIQIIHNFLTNLPDLAKIAIYCLSLDTLFGYIFDILTLFISSALFIVTFTVITLPTLLISIISTKYTAKLLCALIPSGYTPQFLVFLSNIDIPLSSILKDITEKHIKNLGFFKLNNE